MATPWHLSHTFPFNLLLSQSAPPQPRCLSHTSIGTWKRQQTEIGPGFFFFYYYWMADFLMSFRGGAEAAKQARLRASVKVSYQPRKICQTKAIKRAHHMHRPGGCSLLGLASKDEAKKKGSRGRATHEKRVINIHRLAPPFDDTGLLIIKDAANIRVEDIHASLMEFKNGPLLCDPVVAGCMGWDIPSTPWPDGCFHHQK